MATPTDEARHAEGVTLDLGELGGQFTFYSPGELRRWLDHEAAFWAWLQNVPSPATNAANTLRGRWKEVGRIVGQEITGPADLQRKVDVTAEAYKNSRWIHSSTPRAKFVDSIRHLEPERATGALALFARVSQHDLPAPVPAKVVQGYVDGILFEAGSQATDVSTKAALQDLFERWQKELDAAKEARERQNREAADQAATLEARVESIEKSAIASVKNNADKYAGEFGRFGKLYEDRDSQFKALEVTYEAKLKLQAPVTYWRGKMAYHKVQSQSFMRATAWYFAIGFFALTFANLTLLDGQTITTANVSRIVGYATLLLLFIWGGRLVVRMMLSHSHLQADAHERSVMAETYLSLLSKEKVRPDAEKFMLEALMRHSSDGIVKDDAAPWLGLTGKPGKLDEH